MADITMPQLGETVTEGTIIRWLKKVGDEVAHDEPLFEVSTDKVDSEVPSPASGYLAAILVPEGDTVDVGTKLAVVTDEAPSGAAPAAEAAAPAAATDSPAAEAGPPSAATDAPAAEAVPPAAPAAPAVPAVQGPPAADSTAPAPTSAPPAVAAASVSDGAESNGQGGLVLSPVVRQLVAEHGLDPASIPGTGKGGRITRGDVLSLIDRAATGEATRPELGAAAPAGAALPGPSATTAPPATAQPGGAVVAATRSYPPVAGTRDEVVPFTNIRRLTAEHMVRSKATSAHTLAVIEADYEGIDRVRKAHKDRFREEEGIGLTYLPFIARAVVETLRDYPQLNASVGDDELIIHRDVHLGIAVDLEQRGLIVPVVRNADGQSLRGLARATADLASRARTRKLSADDVVGGTFTITNPGPFGTFLTAPIINQPQVAILSTDGIKRRPVVITAPDGTEAIGIHSVGLLALSFDHRAVDGAYASGFLHDLGRLIETRDWAAEL